MIFLLLLIVYFPSLESITHKLDGIACTVIGENTISPIYYSDCWLVSSLGIEQTLPEIIIRNIWISHGKDHGIKITSDGNNSEYAEQYLDNLQEKRGVTREEIRDMCVKSGYSLADIKKELNDQYLMQQAIEMTLAAKGYISITTEEVVDYYMNNTPIVQENYTLQRGETTHTIGEIINKKFIDKNITWDEPYIVNKDMLSNNFQSIDNYEINDIVYAFFDQKQNKSIVFKLLKKTPTKKISLEECYDEIMKMLQGKKYTLGFKEVTQELINSDTVIFDTQELKEECLSFIASR